MAHKRNTGPMTSSPRCGAKTRNGSPCLSPAVRNKKRCRMHGGAKGSGAPKGNKNALTCGDYTREEIAAERAAIRAIREVEALERSNNPQDLEEMFELMLALENSALPPD